MTNKQGTQPDQTTSGDRKGAVTKTGADPWAAIGVGSLVLAKEPGDEGWFEVVVMSVGDDDTLVARWRDYPRYPNIKVARRAVALIGSQAK
jgi:hypothetical protein